MRMGYVSKEQIRQARKVNLAEFLLQEHPSLVKIVGNSLCLRDNPSLYVKRSVPGYLDFGTGEHGNSIDFLTRQLNYSFTDAVAMLCKFAGANPAEVFLRDRPFQLPRPADPPFTRVTSYLTGRGIPESTVQYLIQESLLYQDTFGNAVFVNADRSCCEIRGTGKKPFHGCRRKVSLCFWYLLTNPHPEIVFICEAAIDAVSLYLIHKRQGNDLPAAYISLGGVANQQIIDRFSPDKKTVILAVDNDAAGDICRERNADLPALIPDAKDWNEDLMNQYA